MKKLCFLTLCLFASIGVALSQTYRVTGTVISDDDGEPIMGATVIVKENQSVGAITDMDGKFTIDVPRDAQTLSVSYVGMIPQEVKAVANQHLTIVLKSSTSLEEVVVVAYGQQRKEAITGAVANVKSEAIEKRPIASAAAALEGQALGVQVNNAYGEPGSEPTIRIRGFSSINGSNAPLYVVNGVPMGGSVSDINPADIESVSVLKDASSAALYGNRAANGVILITTKSGRAGEDNLVVQANITQGVYERGIKEYARLDAKEYMEAYWMARRNSLYTADGGKNYTQWSDANAAANKAVQDGLVYNIFNRGWDSLFDNNGKLASGVDILDGYKDDLDWYKPIERSGYRGEYNLNARGGSKKATYYMSVGYLKENGYTKASGMERITGNAKVDVTPNKWFKTGITINGSNQVFNSMTGSADDANTIVNPFYFSRNMASIYPVHLHDMTTGAYLYDEFGNKRYDGGEGELTRPQNGNRHIAWETELNKDRTYRTTLDGTAYADITFLNDFTLTVKGNLHNRNTQKKTYNNSIIGDGAGQGRTSETNYRYRSYTVQQLLNWHRTFNGVHNVEALLGHENYSYAYQYSYAYKVDEKLGNIGELSNFSTMNTLNGYSTKHVTEGYFGRAGYNYDQKYFGEFSLRRDGSSRFYKDNRWGNFWSIGGSWILSREEFIKNIPWINHLKLRAAYGEVGNDASADYYAWMGLYYSTQNGGNGAFYKNQYENRETSWENGQSASIAIESRLFNRMNLSIEVYNKTSKDLLFNVTMPSSIGSLSTGETRPTILKNFGSMANHGLEIGFDIDIIDTKDFGWNFGTNINFLKNEIKELPDEYGEDGYVSGTKKFQVGHGRYDFWLYQFAGVDKADGRSLYLLDDKTFYIDENNYNGVGAKKANEEDRTKMAAANYKIIDGQAYVYKTTYAKKDWSGSAIPKMFGSLTTALRFKNLELSGLFTYQLGGKVLDYSYQTLMSISNQPSALHKDVKKSWIPEQAGIGIDKNGIPALNSTMSSDNNATSDRFLIDASYFVIKNITLSYLVPKPFLNRFGLQGLTLTGSVENLGIFTKLQGMSPQQSFAGTNDNGYLPARVMTVGLNVKF